MVVEKGPAGQEAALVGRRGRRKTEAGEPSVFSRLQTGSQSGDRIIREMTCEFSPTLYFHWPLLHAAGRRAAFSLSQPPSLIGTRHVGEVVGAHTHGHFVYNSRRVQRTRICATSANTDH
jgi:hypothetical protein